ncbi:hypothetical protein [Entomohabitans teleogrylli]|uniref:hypothetical protein n=1 Tax=Entomohabitans teleogrylli TaxID=1384589 RepID=UPI00073DA659|nr:hypothetical protein [Entomohabitans teleogrylli]
MITGNWQIGLDIQSDNIFAVGVVRCRQGWQLRRWWQIPLVGCGADAQSLAPAERLRRGLAGWHKLLPYRHRLRVSFPAGRTLQRQVAAPPRSLNEAQLGGYVAQSAIQQLQIVAEPLYWDYAPRVGEVGVIDVTGGRKSEITSLQNTLSSLHLRPEAMVPDACALQSFLPWLAQSPAPWLVYATAHQWLWAGAERWGMYERQHCPTLADLCQRLGCSDGDIWLCDREPTAAAVNRFDPWCVFAQLQPPLPTRGGDFAVAIGLAIGSIAG